MAEHPGKLSSKIHLDGITNALEPAYVFEFPLTQEQVNVVRAGGGIVDNVSYGQEVVLLPSGKSTVHGTPLEEGGDGLHTDEDSVSL